jgi:PKD repeat protein
MRKKPLSLLILLLFVISTLNVNTMVSAVDHPAIYVEPDSTVDPNLTVGMLYTVSIKTDYTGSDIWGWQLSLTYNPSILEGYELANGDLITKDKNPFADFIPGTFNNTLGELSKTSAYFFFMVPPPYLTSGPGTLANVTFRVVGIGPSDIILGVDTWLVGRHGSPDYTMYNIIDAETMPTRIGHGYFDNTGAEAYPPYPPVAVITADPDAYANDLLTFSGASSQDQDGTGITSYEWDFGDETLGTGETVYHAYTIGGTYTVTLRVTDGQNQVSDLAYFSLTVKDRLPYLADLVKWKLKPEARHWDYSKDIATDDGLVGLTALARNRGAEAINILVTFAIIDAASGTSAGDDIVAVATLEYAPELDVPISVEFDPLLYGYAGTKKILYAEATLTYDSDGNGTPDTDASTKIVRFAIVP